MSVWAGKMDRIDYGRREEYSARNHFESINRMRLPIKFCSEASSILMMDKKTIEHVAVAV